MAESKRDDGGPAFPTEDFVPGRDGGGRNVRHGGMSLRDWLIGQNVAALLSNPAVMDAERFDACVGGIRGCRHIIYVATAHADGLLAARKQDGSA